MATREEVYTEVKGLFGLVPTWLKEVPESALGGFWAQMRDFCFAETRIPNKYKELIGIAVAGTTRCRYCTLFYTAAARMHGATDEEIAEANMFAALTTQASTFLNAQMADYDTWEKETEQIVAFMRKTMSSKPARPRSSSGSFIS